MEPVFYVMAILGCGDGSQMCTQQRLEPARYTSVQACQEAMPAALRRNSDIDFPVISAACKASGPIMVERNGAASRRG
jgi:hypothetical protein